MSFRNLEQQQAAIAAADLENAKKTLVAFVYQKFPALVQCEANSRMIVELVELWGGPDIVPTPEAFLSMLDENGEAALSMLARQPVERTRQQIVAEILSLLASKNDGRDGKFNSFNLRSEEKRMESWSLDALRQRLAEIKTKQFLSSKSTSDLKKIVAEASRPAPQVKVLPAEYTRERINAMPSHEIRRLIRDYTTSVVNDRLFGRS